MEVDFSFGIFGYASGTYKNLKSDNKHNYFRVPTTWRVIVENNLTQNVH
jgi:hypothetical protein